MGNPGPFLDVICPKEVLMCIGLIQLRREYQLTLPTRVRILFLLLTIFLSLSSFRTLLPLVLKAFSSCKTAAPFAHKHHLSLPHPSLDAHSFSFSQLSIPFPFPLLDGHSQSVHVVLVWKERKISSGSFPNVQFTGIFIHISWTFSNRDERSEVMVNRAAFSLSPSLFLSLKKVKEDIEYVLQVLSIATIVHSLIQSLQVRLRDSDQRIMRCYLAKICPFSLSFILHTHSTTSARYPVTDPLLTWEEQN